jgi:anaerobic ribonucleoside-triphosphate reductase activating protein
MRVACVIESSKIYGPGPRTALWLQGCSIRCENCWNDELWSFEGGNEMSSSNLIHTVHHNGDGGFTLLGGEPLDQAPSVHKFILEVQAQGLDVVLYTGYELEELSKIQQKCVAAADIVIHGRYKHELRSVNLLWRGSTNQEILINNSKFKTIDLSEKRQMEIHISDEGRIKILGYPTDELLSSVASGNGMMKSLKITGEVR